MANARTGEGTQSRDPRRGGEEAQARGRQGLQAGQARRPAAALAHGIVVQALVDPGRFPPDRQRALVDQLIDRLRGDEPDKLDA